jgi:hypothetical protein
MMQRVRIEIMDGKDRIAYEWPAYEGIPGWERTIDVWRFKDNADVCQLDATIPVSSTFPNFREVCELISKHAKEHYTEYNPTL